MGPVYEFNVLDSNGYHRVSIKPEDYEHTIMSYYERYIREYYKPPTHLVVSSLPYKALCALPFVGDNRYGNISLNEVVKFRDMKVIHLERWDREIIEVG